MLTAAIIAAIAVAAGIAASGGPDTFALVLKDWKRFLRRYVDDDEARARVEQSLEKFKGEIHNLHGGVSENIQALGKVHRTYTSSMDEYQAVIDRLAKDMLAPQVAMLDIALEIQEVLGDETYGKIIANLRKDAQKRDKKLRKVDAKREKKEAKEAKKAAK